MIPAMLYQRLKLTFVSNSMAAPSHTPPATIASEMPAGGSPHFVVYPVASLHGYPHPLRLVTDAPDDKIGSHVAAFAELPLWDISGLRCTDCEYERVTLTSPTRPYAYTIVVRCPHTHNPDEYSVDFEPNNSVSLLQPTRRHGIRGNLVVIKHTPVSAPSDLLDAHLLNVRRDELPLVHDFVRQYVVPAS
ncbi:hypothetical protein C8F01DRAFT_276401 [Mycena amicta]|nr:hypothetical protein C8F01DRAFT_276401 [Mycena amicta]